jgi:hypothetical protein
LVELHIEVLIVHRAFLHRYDNRGRSFSILGFWGRLHIEGIGDIVERHYIQTSNRGSFSQYTVLLPLTCFWNIHPHIVFVERISVCVESAQFPTCLVHLAITVHRSILLVSKHDPVAWLAFAGTLSTLAADGLVFVTFELSLAASLAVNAAEISMWLFEREMHGKS